MCGQFGIVGPGINGWDLDVFRELGIASMLRGQHGTGIVKAHVNKAFGAPNRFEIEKAPVPSNVLISKLRWRGEQKGDKWVANDFFGDYSANAYLGHVRWATRGKLNLENTHPFEFSNIIGFHNGTLLETRYHDKSDADRTDSEMFMEDINDFGMVDVLSELDPKSAYSVVIMDKNTGLLHFARNDHRPLHFCVHDNRSTLYYASESEMLKWILNRNNEQFFENSSFYFSPGYIYTMDPNDPLPQVKRSSIWDVTKLKVREKKVYPLAVTVAPSVKNDDNELPQSNTTSDTATDTVKVVNTEKSNTVGELLNLFEKKDTTLKSSPLGYIPEATCCKCKKNMDLVDQFFGEQYGAGVWMCEPCESQDNATLDKINVEQ